MLIDKVRYTSDVYTQSEVNLSLRIFVEKYFILEKFHAKIILWLMLTYENFLTMKLFTTCHCLRMNAAWLLDCTTSRTTSEIVIKGELLLRSPFLFVHLGYRNWRASACCRVFDSCNERDWYAVVVIKDSMVVPRILAELHVLSKVVILELVSSFKIFV